MISEPRVLDSRFTLVLQLGSGGQASVWLGQDELLKRSVALKQLLLKRDGEHADAVRERAIGEAQAMARVRHRTIVPIHDIRFIPDSASDPDDPSAGDPWLVMEFIEGKTLLDLIAAPPPAVPLDDTTIARIGLEVLDGLTAVHRAGIVHRDVKPDNILIAGDLAAGSHSVYLVDFGIAKINGGRSVTEQNAVIGTLTYIAPERLLGEQAWSAADLWSLGATLYCAVDGAPPFRYEGEYPTYATRDAILHQAPLPPRRESALTGIILRMLVKDPRQRADADEVRTALASILRRSRQVSQPPVPGPGEPDADGYLLVPQRGAGEPGPRPRRPAPRPGAPGRPRPDEAPWPVPRTAERPAARPSARAGDGRRDERAGAPNRARMRVEDVRDLILKVGIDTGVAMLLSIPAEDAAAILASCPGRQGGELLAGIAVAQPQSASSIMEMIGTPDAARLLDHVGSRAAASLLAGMPPRSAVRILSAATDETASQSVKRLPVRQAVLLFRAMSSYRAAIVLSHLKPVNAAAVLGADPVLEDAVWPLIPQPEREQIGRYLRGQR